MGIIKEEDKRKEYVMQVAVEMLSAGRTSPKARGIDRLYLAVIEGKEVEKLSKSMISIAEKGGPAFFKRDAENLLQAQAVVIMGTSYEPQELPLCGYCGFKNCENKRKEPDVPCVFNTGDLGIAIGSAVSVAMNKRTDNRIMYSAGYTAVITGMLPADVKIAYAIPLSVSAKNPFFDRK